MEGTKQVAMRTCIATGVKKPKSEMVRVVRLMDEDDSQKVIVKIDPKGKERGRGANIDSNIEAFELAVKKGAIERALKLESKLTVDEISQLRKDFNEVIDERKFRQGNKRVVYKVSKEELDSKLAV